MAEIHLSLDLFIVLVDYLEKTKKEYKRLKKQEIQNIFIKKNQINLAFNRRCIMWVLKI